MRAIATAMSFASLMLALGASAQTFGLDMTLEAWSTAAAVGTFVVITASAIWSISSATTSRNG